VAIFGGSATIAGEGAYEDARYLGRLLGEHGDTVLTGAYSGVMEAASRGCKEGGGHVIGFTCAQIEALRGVNANPWVQEVRRFDTLRERMHALIDACEAAVVMPGGVGTLCELLVMWNEMIIDQKTVRPLLIVGKSGKPCWQNSSIPSGVTLGKRSGNW
jgi:uncharacterized protein (TIGR00725 family)